MKTIDLKKHIRDIPNFPKEGIIFKDISTLLKNKDAFKHAIDTRYTEGHVESHSSMKLPATGAMSMAVSRY